MKKILSFCFAVLFSLQNIQAQRPENYSSADIALELERLQVLGTVLYLAAHPDDENTRLIAWLENEKKYRTGYLSLTRGDGGQNLIGSDIREKLGVIRTQELLQARRIDGGEQFFSRANDFGFSKHPDETFSVWDKEQVLADVVYVIRKFKPDVIITRFSTEPGITHGHHTASAILAEEAFEAAADPARFPEQLKTVDVWQPKRLLWNTSSWFYEDKEDFDTTTFLKVDVGLYNPVIGKSYTEIAAISRSMHKSQGFGSALQRGSAVEYLKPILGSDNKEQLFHGINTSWSRVEGGEKVQSLISAAIMNYNIKKPSVIVPQLLEIYKAIQSLPSNPYKEEKLEETKDLIRACMGLYLEVAAKEMSITPGDSLSLEVEAINRSSIPVNLKVVTISGLDQSLLLNQQLKENEKVVKPLKTLLPEEMSISQPHWLVNEPTNGMFKVTDEEKIGKPENDPPLDATFEVTIQGIPFRFNLPVVYKYTDPAKGEIYQPFMVIPPVAVNPKADKLLFTKEGAKELAVEVVAGTDSVQGNLRLNLPEGWKSRPESFEYHLMQKGASALFRFSVEAPEKSQESSLKAEATYDGKVYDRGIEFLRYDHIPTQVIFPRAQVKLVKVQLATQGKRIGYVMGAGDELPEILGQIGYQVELLRPNELEAERLKQYDAVVLGVRALNTQEELKYKKGALEQYARDGGTVIIQYNTNGNLVDENFTPFELKLSRKRVTMEDAPVTILQPGHPVFQGPNKITAKDFDGWVQERGLYFAEEWSDQWTPLLASHDPGEEPLKGGLLVAEVGKGYFVYTGYSWFRQLPAGVPGAYRIFVNLLSLGNSRS